MTSLATCRYQNFQTEMGLPVRSTAGAPRWRLPYRIAEHFREITPKREWLHLQRDDFTERYGDMLTEYGVQRLQETIADIAARHGADRLVLLCFEDLTKPGLWCHRTIFADWWLAHTGEQVPEIGFPNVRPTRRKPADRQMTLDTATVARVTRPSLGR